MSTKGPFHEGEIALQERAGQRAVALRNGGMIGDAVMPGARSFVGQQRTVAVATLDDNGRPWATLWVGDRGFIESDTDGRSVWIAPKALRHATAGDDPATDNVRLAGGIGLLAIELGSRRRLRINGTVSELHDERLVVSVRESFPNCPKYIQKRELRITADARAPASIERGTVLDAERLAFVRRVDTTFVASQHPERGLDASHRGGAPGFVHALDSQTLRFPDYPGNGMFQTLGNLEIDPRAGVVLVDFDRGRLLSLTGTTTTSHGTEDPLHPSGGTARYWVFRIDEWHQFPMATAGIWSLAEPSPVNPAPFAGLPGNGGL